MAYFKPNDWNCPLTWINWTLKLEVQLFCISRLNEKSMTLKQTSTYYNASVSISVISHDALLLCLSDRLSIDNYFFFVRLKWYKPCLSHDRSNMSNKLQRNICWQRENLQIDSQRFISHAILCGLGDWDGCIGWDESLVANESSRNVVVLLELRSISVQRLSSRKD